MHIKDAHKRAEPTRYIKHFFTRPSGKESLENDCKWKAHLTKKPKKTDEPSVCSSGLIIFFFLLAVEPVATAQSFLLVLEATMDVHHHS